MRTCLSCGAEIPDRAAICKACGNRTGLRKRELGTVALLVLGVAAAWLVRDIASRRMHANQAAEFEQTLEETVAAEDMVRNRLPHPDTAIFGNITHGCGLVTYKNAFGGMAVDRRFIVQAGKVMLDSDWPQGFDTAWSVRCARHP